MAARIDGRAADELRPVTITRDFLMHPLGSVLISCGRTRVVCAASVEDRVPPWMKAQKVPGGWITSEYGMLPASTGERMKRESSAGKPGGRTMEIQRLIGRSMRAMADLNTLGEHTIYLDCDVIDADGGTRCASICGASVVLQIAFRKLLAEKKIQRFPMRENVGAISVGIRGGVPLLDLCYEEDSGADVDFNVVMTESGKFIELQGTAEEVPFDREQLDKILELAQIGLAPVFEAQNKILSAYPLPRSNEPFGSLGAAFSNIKLK